MNRRRLILTALGALAGCLGLPKVALAAVAPKPKVPIAQLYVSVSQEVSDAIAGMGPYPVHAAPAPLIRIGSLMINSEEEAQAFLKSMAEAIRKASQRGA